MICTRKLVRCMNKNFKKILSFLIVFIIGISTTVGAVTIFNSKDITYSSDKTTKTNVKEALDELYENLGKCPKGQYCYTDAIGLSDKVELGDYIRMTPLSTNYIPQSSLTGYTGNSQKALNPSELNLWRVIKKNSDGTIDVVSEYISSNSVYIYGITGYKNLIGIFKLLADQYTNPKFVSKTRSIGYNNQIEKCFSVEQSLCPAWEQSDDRNLINKILGTLGAVTPTGEERTYSYPIRGYNIYENGIHDIHTFAVLSDGTISGSGLARGMSSDAISEERLSIASFRPIVTLKSNINLISGDGKSAETAYNLE